MVRTRGARCFVPWHAPALRAPGMTMRRVVVVFPVALLARAACKEAVRVGSFGVGRGLLIRAARSSLSVSTRPRRVGVAGMRPLVCPSAAGGGPGWGSLADECGRSLAAAD